MAVIRDVAEERDFFLIVLLVARALRSSWFRFSLGCRDVLPTRILFEHSSITLA